MKALKIFPIIFLLAFVGGPVLAQKAKTESFKVSGECGMCKKKIEKSAKEAGATSATWNVKTKLLTVSYPVTSTSASAIQKKIADSGYDTPGFKASDEAYNKLDACCQYERAAVNKPTNCCVASCEMKDGKCKDEAACKAKGCCKDAKDANGQNCCSDSKTDTNSH
jgi:hypothetical protein